MEFRAEMRYLRVSPQKARLVLELIKGRKVEEARNTLLYTKKRVAAHVGKLLQSALDNANFLSAEKNLDVDLDNLYVKSAIANDGPRMKRIRPAPQGRAYRYQRRIAHITLVLAEDRRVRLRPSGARRWLRKWRARLVRKRRLRNSGKKQVPHPRFARVRNDKVFACGKVFGLIRRSNGTKSPSLWFSARLHQAVEVALVRR